MVRSMLIRSHNRRHRTSLMDPLSDVLSLLRPRAYVTGALTAGGRWSVHFPAHEGIKCYSVVAGECWLSMDGVQEPSRLRAGNCLLSRMDSLLCWQATLRCRPWTRGNFSHPW